MTDENGPEKTPEGRARTVCIQLEANRETFSPAVLKDVLTEEFRQAEHRAYQRGVEDAVAIIDRRAEYKHARAKAAARNSQHGDEAQALAVAANLEGAASQIRQLKPQT